MSNAAFVKEFEKLIGKDNVFTGEANRQVYAFDAAALDPVTPALVLRPTHTEQLGPLMRRCYAEGLTVTVRGAGTNLSGGTVPDSNRSVVLLTNALNSILEINREDGYAVVEPGVVTQTFAEAVARAGLFYPPDPGSQSVSTLGGNVAENAGGLRGLKYGVTKDYVLGLDFYDGVGELIKTGARTVKCATGFNLAGLMTGSEGCFGVISRILLRLVPPPKASKAMLAVFDDVQKAAEAVAGIMAANVVPCTLEYLDHVTINRVEDHTGVGLPRDAAALLLIEVDGHPAQVADDAAVVEAELARCGATAVQSAGNDEEKQRIWEARRGALPALARVKPTCILEDVTVPRSKIPAMVEALGKLSAEFHLDMGVFGHAGDGNLHPTILCDRRDKDEALRVNEALDAMFEAALALGGTLSGEHGIGIAKVAWLERETSPGTISLSRRLRRALDPKGLLNPGKVTPL